MVRQQFNFSPAGSTCETEDYQVNLDGVSALGPAGSYQCWSPDNSGAGWQDWQVVSGKADHCYFMDGNKASVGCVGIGDPNWLPPAAENWSFASNMAWLASMGTSRTCSQDGY